MKFLKIIAILLAVYVGIVVAFESLIGYFQPESEGTLTLINTDGDQRVVSRLAHDDTLYVAANHWPRAWYTDALENPQVTVLFNGVKTRHVAVPVSGAEHEAVDSARPLPLVFRILTGFPPRYFLRLDPA